MSAVVKQERQRAIRELVARTPIASQDELVLALARRGFAVTQATVSRDIAELGLVKVGRGDRHVYIAPEDLAPTTATVPAGPARADRSPADDRLRRILSDVPVRVRRSGLILLLVGTPGTASVIAQAIDDSTLDDQEGTLAGDDTLLVLFATEARLERWRERFARIAGSAEAGSDANVESAAPSTLASGPVAPVASSRASAGTAAPVASSSPRSMPDPSQASADADAVSHPIVSEASR